MYSRTNEFVGRKIALMEATGVLSERTDFNALSDGTLIDRALEYKVESDEEVLRNLDQMWSQIFDFKAGTKVWAGDIIEIRNRAMRDIYVHRSLVTTDYKYNELGFFEDEFRAAQKGLKMLTEDRYRALEVIMPLSDKNLAMLVYRLMMKYGIYSDIKTLSCKWVWSYSVQDYFDGKLVLDGTDWEYR